MNELQIDRLVSNIERAIDDINNEFLHESLIILNDLIVDLENIKVINKIEKVGK